MAGLQQRCGNCRVLVRYHGKRYAFHLGEVSRKEAETEAAQVDYLLLRPKQRLIALPAGVRIVDFVRYDNKPPTPHAASDGAVPARRTVTTLITLRDRYLATHQESLEERHRQRLLHARVVTPRGSTARFLILTRTVTNEN